MMNPVSEWQTDLRGSRQREEGLTTMAAEVNAFG